MTTGLPLPPPEPRRRWNLLGLGAALAAAAALIGLPPVPPRPGLNPPTEPPPKLADVWPEARPVTIPGVLPDGMPYTPLYILAGGASLGQAPSPDGRYLRLVARAADGVVRELRRLPIAATPQYVGFVSDGAEVAWAESHAGSGPGRTEIWAVAPASGKPPRRVTADTGDVVFFNSQYDLVARDGRLHWVAVASSARGGTELRSVPLAGGSVSIRTEAGEWALSAWPWLVSAGSGQSGPVRLRNLDTGRERTVPVTPTELVNCSPTWCRVLVLPDGAPTRLELMRVDGSQRRKVAGGTAASAVMDVALLDRFEVLSMTDARTAALTEQRLMLYDIAGDRMVVAAERAGSVLARDGALWWSTGVDETSSWQVLDLRALR